jgi:hypothetical protein
MPILKRFKMPLLPQSQHPVMSQVARRNSILPSRQQVILTSMTRYQGFLKVLVLLSVFCGRLVTGQAQDQPERKPERKDDIKILEQSEWKEIKITIYRDGKPPLENVLAKQSVYRMELGDRFIPTLSGLTPQIRQLAVTGVIVPESGIRWIGIVPAETDPEWSNSPTCIYIEFADQLMCGYLFGRGVGMDWVPNLLDRDESGITDLDSLTTLFEAGPVLDNLKSHGLNWDFSKKNVREEVLSSTLISDYLGDRLSLLDSSGSLTRLSEKVKPRINKVEEGVVDMNLVNQGMKKPIQIWIDLEYRQVVRAKTGQEQTYPRYPAGTEKHRQMYITSNALAPKHTKLAAEMEARAIEHWIIDVEMRYRDLRGKGKSPQDFSQGERFSQLMREWTPINCTADQLNQVAGKPTRESKESLEYQFDDGTGKEVWKFTLSSAGVIRGVEFTPKE